MNTNSFTMEEPNKAIKHISTNKACGLDDLPADVWKNGTFRTSSYQL